MWILDSVSFSSRLCLSFVCLLGDDDVCLHSWHAHLACTGMVNNMDPRLREPYGQDAGSRNLGQAFMISPVQGLSKESTLSCEDFSPIYDS